MKAYELRLLVHVDAKDEDAAGKIAERVYAVSAEPIRLVPGVRWLFPVADIKERAPFATPPAEGNG